MESWNDDPQQGDNEKIPELDDGTNRIRIHL